MPQEAKGGAFAPADMKLIRKALHVYLTECVLEEEANGEAHPDVKPIANLLHRIGRIGR